jgi:hypothetical protein
MLYIKRSCLKSLLDGWMGGWVDGWVGRWVSRVKYCLQQSKIILQCLPENKKTKFLIYHRCRYQGNLANRKPFPTNGSLSSRLQSTRRALQY